VYPKVVSEGHYYTCYALQTFQTYQNLTAAFADDTAVVVHINIVQLPQEEDVKYLGLHLDRRLTWHKHIFTKRKQLEITPTKMYWLLGRKSKLSKSNKLLIYKTTSGTRPCVAVALSGD
jgi:hypothetical protein